MRLCRWNPGRKPAKAVPRPLRNLAVLLLSLPLTVSSVIARDATRPVPVAQAPVTLAEFLGDSTLKSAAGQDFRLLKSGGGGGRQQAKWRFLVQGGLHGNEQLASEFVEWLAGRYARGESPLNRLPAEEVEIDFLPHANPDGFHGHSRYNARGVNLNRNFAMLWGLTRENPGSGSFSEPETRAIRRLFDRRDYTAAVDVHGYINWIVAPSSPVDVAARGYRPSTAQVGLYRQWTNSLKDEMALLPGYELKTGARLGDGGAFEDWAFWQKGTLAWCLELESFRRHVKPWRRDFADPSRFVEAPAIDLFKRYEMFIHRMFTAAIEIRSADPVREDVVSR